MSAGHATTGRARIEGAYRTSEVLPLGPSWLEVRACDGHLTRVPGAALIELAEERTAEACRRHGIPFAVTGTAP